MMVSAGNTPPAADGAGLPFLPGTNEATSCSMRSRKPHHLLAGRGQRVAGALALEQPRAEPLFDLAETAERRRVVNAKRLRRTVERAGVGNRLHMAEIVPRKHPMSLQTGVFTAFTNQEIRTDVACRGQ